MQQKYPLTVFYDGNCPLCAEEINLMRSCNSQQRVLFINCAAEDFDDRPFHTAGINQQKMLQQIHVYTAQQQWLMGIEAMEQLYRALDQNFVANMLGGRFSKPIALRIYPHFVRFRFVARWLGISLLFRLLTRYHAKRSLQRSQQCQQGQCDLTQMGVKK